MALPGTVSIRPEILCELLYDVVDSMAQHGFDKFVLLNGHRIVNISWMQIAAERAKRNLGVKVVIADPAYLSRGLGGSEELGSLGHADEIETSHMLLKYPNLVNLDLAVDYAPPVPDLFEVDPSFAGDVLCYVPKSKAEMGDSVREAGGTTGRPSRSSEEKGERYFEWVTDGIADVVARLKSGEI